MFKSLPAILLLVGMFIAVPAAQSLAAAPIQAYHNLGDSVTASATITGSQYQFVSLVFSGPAGHFGYIFLNPQKTIDQATFSLGQQTLTINRVTFEPPTPISSGTVTIDCTYTDPNGQNEVWYSGVLFAWSLNN